MSQIELGKQAEYPEQYSPECLEPIPRRLSRSSIGLLGELPFDGVDLWTAYEVSWLDGAGKPQVAMGYFEFCCRSEAIVESKSFKYYLNSFNQSTFESWQKVTEVMESDLAKASGGKVSVKLVSLNSPYTPSQLGSPNGACVDELSLNNAVYTPSQELLTVDSEQHVEEALYSHLLKSNCPVTGQPDWATLWVEYKGKRIEPESFLAYVVSYRQHQDFHENCVEKIYSDILQACKPESLSVYARYTRRGGLDINPYRTNTQNPAPKWRIVRQ